MANRNDEIETVGGGSYHNHRIGQWSEFQAAAFLTRRKFEVYSHHGQSICDLIAVKRKGLRLLVHLIEVKHNNLEYGNTNFKDLRKEQKMYGIKLLVVNSDGAVVPHFELEK